MAAFGKYRQHREGSRFFYLAQQEAVRSIRRVVRRYRNWEKWFCLDCGEHTGRMGEFYMVEDWVWADGAGGSGMLCIGCLEERLGRRLESRDFMGAPVNYETFDLQSERLRDRLGDDFPHLRSA